VTREIIRGGKPIICGTIAASGHDDKTSDNWSDCARCALKSGRRADFHCLGMGTHDIRYGGARLTFWRRSLTALGKLPASRFEPAAMAKRPVAFPELWNVEAEVMREFKVKE
jgi:hypothetical protein